MRHSSISIPALREEGDEDIQNVYQVVINISIHALREEGDFGMIGTLWLYFLFLSTPSARRATVS